MRFALYRGNYRTHQKNILEHFGIKVALKPHQTIGNLFLKPKDPVPKAQIRAPIYKIPCRGCEKCYRGETKRQFATREGERKKAVRKCKTKKSQLTQHCKETAIQTPGTPLKSYARAQSGIKGAFWRPGKINMYGGNQPGRWLTTTA